MTASFEVRYRWPTPPRVTVRAEAWITAVDGRKVTAEGRIRNAVGEPTVEAIGVLIHQPSWLR